MSLRFLPLRRQRDRCRSARSQSSKVTLPPRRLWFESLEQRQLLSATRLDDPQAFVGDVHDFRTSRDGRFGIYVADAATGGVNELFSVAFASGEVSKLNESIAASHVVDYQISEDSQHVVFSAQQAAGNIHELYSVPIAGGSAKKLNSELVPGGTVITLSGASSFSISPDSATVAYLADQDEVTVRELFRVPIGGGEVVKLNEPLAAGGDVLPGFQFSADSEWLVYRADLETDGSFELYSVSVNGGTPTKLNNSLVAGGAVHSMVEITPDSQTVVYVADQDTNGVDELYSAPIASGGATKLSTAVVDSGVRFFEIAPDGSRVVYSDSAAEDLYSVALADGSSVQLTGTLVAGGHVGWFAVSPNSSQVVFLADQEVDQRSELYRVAIDGGEVVKLSGPIADGEVGVWSSFRGIDGSYRPPVLISGDGSRIVYQASGHSGDLHGLYSAPLAGGEFAKLDGPLVENGTVASFQISPDSSRVIYRADQDVRHVEELYSVPLAGGDATKVSGELVDGGSVWAFRVAHDSSRIVYIASQQTPGVDELFSAPITGGSSTKWSSPLSALGGDVQQFALSPDGRYAVYLADQLRQGFVDLYSVETATGKVERLNGISGVEGFQIDPDGSRVVYVADSGDSGFVEVHAVPIDGGTAIPLVETRSSNREVLEFQINSSGTHVVYRADGETEGTFELFSVPLAGGEPAKLNGPLAANGDVLPGFELSTDGLRAVYLADQDTDAVVELYSVLVAGGNSIRLNDPLHPTRAVKQGFQISADSTRVVYLADQETDNVFELYSAALNGGGAVKLNDQLVEGGDVRDVSGTLQTYQISPDSESVVYVADQDTDNVFELYRVPLNGGGSKKLNPTLVFGGDVESGIQIDATSNRVVYRADRTTDRKVEIYSVPLLGGESVTLSGTLDEEVQVGDFQLSSDGSHVVFPGATAAGLVKLYSAPLSGGGATRLNDPLVDGGTISRFEISLDGKRVVYVADQETDDTFELFSSSIDGGGAQKISDPLVLQGDVTADFQISPDNVTAFYLANQDVVSQFGLYATSLDASQTGGLMVASIAAISSGFVIEFDAEIDPSRLNLYDSGLAQLGAPDVTLQGEVSGIVNGSLVISQSLRTATFIATGGALAPDTYSYRLRSGTDGFNSAAGGLLDGNGDGAAGDDLIGSFAILPPAADTRVVSIPDFVRGPGQPVHLPAGTAGGIPISISDGTGVRSIRIAIHYAPEMLGVVGATLGDDMPSGATVLVDTSNSGVAAVTLTSPSELPSGGRTVVHLQATVPDNAGVHYSRHQIVRLADLEIRSASGVEIPAVADDALHVVEFFGDVSANGVINAADASRVARVASSLDGGFTATPRTDPRIAGDMSGNGVVNSADAAMLARFAAAVPVPEIPPLPAGGASYVAGLRSGLFAELGTDADGASHPAGVREWKLHFLNAWGAVMVDEIQKRVPRHHFATDVAIEELAVLGLEAVGEPLEFVLGTRVRGMLDARLRSTE